ncbi:MAG: cyclic nucleotide-binding domain-containing protein [Chloroflexi bacterium]|nr:cyclic nucleotide-binding domain-containing protein [Chloroflexota bacterium]
MKDYNAKEFLTTVPIFSGLPDDVLEKLAAITREMEFKEGEVVFEENSPGEAMYIVIDGDAVAEKVIEGERHKVLGTFGKGDLFGEMALFDRQPRSARIKALSPLTILELSQKEFQKFLISDTEDAARILGRVINVLTRRLRQTDQELVTLYETGKIAGSAQELNKMLNAIMERIMMSLTDADCGLTMLYNQYTEEFEPKASRGLPGDEVFGLTMDMTHPIVKAMLEGLEKDPDLIEAKLLDGISWKDPEFLKMPSVMVVPLSNQGRLFGFIFLGNKERSFAFKSNEINLVKAVAAQVASAVENALFRQEEVSRERLGQVYW